MVDSAGLILPGTLAQQFGLSQLVDWHLDLGRATGRVNVGDKLMILVASARADGDGIDDVGMSPSGMTVMVLGCTVKAPSTLGTFLRSFRWGHVRQLDWVSRELLVRSRAAGAGPRDAPFTVDLDSAVGDAYGLDKEGARLHGYSSVQAITPCWPVPTSCGRQWEWDTLGRTRYAGPRGRLTVRADTGFYTYLVVAVCPRMNVPSPLPSASAIASVS